MAEVEPFYFDLAKRIKEAREFRGISQANLAAGIGLTRTAIVNIEKARQRVAVHLLVLICNHLSVDIKDILRGI